LQPAIDRRAVQTMTAAVRVGSDADGLELELFQPVCLDHEPPWLGPETFDLATAKLNARVHNTNAHRDGA
jgi:hypothetical protein